MIAGLLTLANGTRLGPYEIVSILGAGGMGEVYRANDTRLGRQVAIKVLLSDRTASDELRARFEREAHAISALSHPNICALFDVGHEGDIEYLVMEYLEGETLAERIARGPLPFSHVQRYGAQIAEALQSAHRAGITHRDLKPGNIMLTGSGVKLLDFGLAKLIDPSTGGLTDPFGATARIDPLTAKGLVVGTFPYMSPEQIEGKPLDHRSDIFSLGVILYEMATGVRPFQGASPMSLMSAILSSDPPPVRSVQPATPAALERIILTALEKNPDERWQTAHDVARQLRWLGESSTTTEQTMAPASQRRGGTALLVIGVALASALLTYGLARWLTPAAQKPASLRLQFAPPPGIEARRSFDTNLFAISPDGRTLCFVAAGSGGSALYVRPLDSFDVKRIDGTEDAMSPFWSPGGDAIGFSAHGKLWKTRIAGGATPELLCDAPSAGANGSWRGSTILFNGPRDGKERQIFRVSDRGGARIPVTTLQAGEWRHGWPTLLSDGDHFFYVAFTAGSLERQLILGSLSSLRRSLLLSNVSQARVIGDDRLVYVRDAKLTTQRFDAEKGTMVGDPEVIASDVAYFHPSARGDFDASPTGTIVYRTDTSTAKLLLVDREGKEIRLLDDKEIFFDHSLSPDGRKAAVSVMTRANGLCDIWIYDTARGVRERFTNGPGVSIAPVWSPDARSIVYSDTQGGVFPHIVRRLISGVTSEDLLPRGPFDTARSFSPDGETLYYDEFVSTSREDIYTFSMKTKTATPFLRTNFAENEPQASPDGKSIAFVSNATGTAEIYVQNLNDPASRMRVSASGGENPRWRGDGKELFFVSAGRTVISATPRTAGRWDDATLKELFRAPDSIQGFAVMPDGKSFLISYSTRGAADSLFHVIVGAR